MRWVSKLMAFAIAAVLFIPSGRVSAEGAVRVTFDNVPMVFEVNPVIVEGTTLVPFRSIFERMGMKVTWNNEYRTVTGIRDGLILTIPIDSRTVYVNGSPLTLEVPAKIVSDVTMVPVRFVGESSGYSIAWDQGTRTVIIQSPPDGGTRPPAAVPSPGSKSVEDIAELSDRVVYLELYDEEGEMISAGSGVVLSRDGKIVTNYHVIEGAAGGKVILSDDRELEVKTVLNHDRDRDLALLQTEPLPVAPVTLGRSSALKDGEQVVAIGSPLGLKNTVSTGIVSARNRMVDGYPYIQISVPIDHGSSGGALFNLKGSLWALRARAMRARRTLTWRFQSVP
ncbi:stalk domain-containing protein [Paenibacillus sp. CC-CFT747]|nr:stalk domain-containing protein [Paenibacillus sp. CC-CFT747]